MAAFLLTAIALLLPLPPPLTFALVKVATGPHGAGFCSEFSVLTMSSSPGDTWAP